MDISLSNGADFYKWSVTARTPESLRHSSLNWDVLSREFMKIFDIWEW